MPTLMKNGLPVNSKRPPELMADKTMKVFKFGGASLQNVENIRRVVAIIKQQNKKDDSLLIVVSAAGKSTTLLENILALWLNHDATASELFQQNIVRYYEGLLSGYRNGLKPEEAFQKLINEAISYLENPAPDDENLAYDMLVSYGELLTSLLLVQLLQSEGITIEWEDARKLFRTDRNYRDASIDWQQSQANIELLLSKKLKHSLVLTQGFIASDDLGKSTTLGREGSDYSAAIFASILDAKSVTVWKDVPGVMTADPSIYPHAVLIDRLSYRDAIEMTFYGAKIIHPKTLQPLENKQIPLFVKSFLQPEAAGTHVCHLESGRKKLAPICVTKPQQVFFSAFYYRPFFLFLNGTSVLSTLILHVTASNLIWHV